MRDSCVFYRAHKEAIKACPEEYRAKIYDMVFDYMFDDIEPETKEGFEYALFLSMKTNIDRSKARYKASVENGKQGGRPAKNETPDETQYNPEKPKNNPDETQYNPEKPNQNLNDNDNDNDNLKENKFTNVNLQKKKIEEQLFLKFWCTYPKKVAKQAALKTFRKLKVDEETLGKILEGVAKWVKTEQWLCDNGKYIPEPAKFLNGRRWEDDLQSCCSISDSKPSYDLEEYEKHNIFDGIENNGTG